MGMGVDVRASMDEKRTSEMAVAEEEDKGLIFWRIRIDMWQLW